MKTKTKKIREFDVPSDLMGDFAEMIEEHALSNWIEGVNEQGEIILMIEYTKQQDEVIEELYDLLESYEQEEDEDDEEYDEDDDE